MKAKKSPAQYPIRAAARLTRLSIDTLRAWEKRYGVVKPERQNGIRMYTQADIERLQLIRRVMEHGHSIGSAAKLDNAGLTRLIEVPASRMETAADKPVETLLTAIEQFRYAAADRELGRLASLMGARDIIHQIALPIMRIVGERWHEQRLRIAQEHLLTQLLSNLLGGMIRIYAHENPETRIITATLSDDLHEFGILAAAILAAGAGLGVIHLGANLPSREIAYAVKQAAANILLLSITSPPDKVIRTEQLKQLRSALSPDVEIWVGVNPAGLRFEVAGVRLLKDFAELERELQRIGGRF